MSDWTPPEFSHDVLGVYDGFDTVVTVNFSQKDISNPYVAQHVAGHEQFHFFQNFFTLQGLSYYQVVRFIEGLTEDLLLAWRAPIPVPAFHWLQTLPDINGKLSSAHYFDRYVRLFTQLASTHVSVNAVNHWSRSCDPVDIARCLQENAFKIDVVNRTFCISGAPVFQIDYSAICESMAKAMEYFNSISTVARFENGGSTPTQDDIATATNKIFNAAGRDMVSHNLLNYTFPLLYLRQSGYDLHEAIHLTIVLDYISLMNSFSKASLPELGVKDMVKFGTSSSYVYAKLLQYAYEDKFLPIFDRLIADPTSFSSIVDYLDEIALVAGVNCVSETHKVLGQYSDTFCNSLREAELPRNLWYIRILGSAKVFCQKLKSEPALQGLTLLLSPSMFLYDSNVGPAIVCTDKVTYQLKDPDSVSTEIATFTASLNFVKTLLFGWDHLRVEFGSTSESARLAFAKYLQQFGVSIAERANLP